MTTSVKALAALHDAPPMHWVGDGFPVRSLFSYHRDAPALSPFLLLDHAGPAEFAPASRPRGVGEHPHRGFETVTIVYAGEVAHRDSAGNGGVIGPGDVQWMTAAGGILHEEFHSEAFTRTGGPLEMAQLWVNLPAAHKMAAPGYQAIVAADIPEIAVADGAGSLRVIAGEYAGRRGPARTFTPMNVWDLRLAPGARTRLEVPEGHTLAVAVLGGTVEFNGSHLARAGQVARFERAGAAIEVEANNDAKLLVLGGEPIDEPIAGYGPFVMNTDAEIEKAIADFRAGRFGRMAA